MVVSYVAHGGAGAATTVTMPTQYASVAAHDSEFYPVFSDSASIGAPNTGTWRSKAAFSAGGMSCRFNWRVAAGGETGTIQTSITGGTKGVSYIGGARPANAAKYAYPVVRALSDSDTSSTAYSASGSAWQPATTDLIMVPEVALAATGTFTTTPTMTFTSAGSTLTPTTIFHAKTGSNTVDYGLVNASVSASGSGVPTLQQTMSVNAGGVAIAIKWSEVDSCNPTVNAGTDQTVAPSATVTLSGSGAAAAPGGNAVTYSWAQTAGAAVTLSSTMVASPTFTAPASGTFTFVLTVTDEWGFTSTDDVVVTVSGGNSAPNVTVDKTSVRVGETVTLTATDTDGTIASVLVSTTYAPTTGYIGDSLTVGQGEAAIATDLSSLGYVSTNLKVNGLTGRSISATGSPFPSPGSIDVVNTWRSGGFHPTVWVIALCSNDFDQAKAGVKTRISTLLSTLSAETLNRVLWVGPVVRPGSSLQTSVDSNLIPALTESVTDYADTIDIRFFNLQTALRALGLNEESPALWIDDRHMTTAGYDLRKSLIHNFIQSNLPAFTRPTTSIGGGQWTFTAPSVPQDTVYTSNATDNSGDSDPTPATTTVRADLKGSASGTTAFIGAASGKLTSKAAGGGSQAWTGTATGKRTPTATGAGSQTWAGTSVGNRASRGAASGSHVWVGGATGKRIPEAAGSGAQGWIGTGTGKRTPKAGSTGTVSYSGSAIGFAPVVGGKSGAATGAVGYLGTSTGKRAPKASSVGASVWSGSAAGLRPVVPAKTGSANGAAAWTGIATGRAVHRGQSTGGVFFTGTSSGTRPADGPEQNVIITGHLGPRLHAGAIKSRRWTGGIQT